MKTLFTFTDNTLKKFDNQMKTLGYEYDGSSDIGWHYTNKNSYDYQFISVNIGNGGVIGVNIKNRWTGKYDTYTPSVKNYNQFFNFIKDFVK